MPASTRSRPTLWGYFVRHRSLFLWGGLALLCTNVIQLLVPRILGWVVDALRAAGFEQGLEEGVPAPEGLLSSFLSRLFAPLESWVKEITLSAPVMIALLLFGVAILAALIRILSRVLIFLGGRQIEYELRRTIFDHLLLLSPLYFRNTQTGDILSRASNDLTSVRLVFGPGILNIVNTAITFASGLPILISISPSLTVISLLPFPIVLGISFFIIRRIFLANIAVQKRLAELSSQAEEAISGVSVVQAYAREEAFAERFGEGGKAYIAASMGLVKTRGLMGPLIGSIGGLGIVLALYFGGKRVIAGEMSLGDLIAFQAYLAMLTWPMTALGFVLSLFERGRAAFSRITQLLDEVPALADPEDPLPAPERADLELKNFSFRYGDTEVLHDISLKIPAGTSLGIVGSTGSGKSTLVMALARLLEVGPGQIFFGGRDVTRLPLSAVRSRVALVPQEPFLFADTIAENLAFGLGGDSPEVRDRITEAARVARFWEEVEGFPLGLDTEIGERGVQLSGGQKQRASLARGLACDPEILILDDALSAVDAHTESEILAKLPEISRGRTTIIVSHRVAAVKQAHQIIVLERGRIVEQGTHEELCAKNGRYAELDRLQRLSEEIQALPSHGAAGAP